MEFNRILRGDCLTSLKTLPDKSINCCVTSPPYYGLRDYGTGKWVGGDPNCKHKSAKIKTRFDYELSDVQQHNKGSDVPSYMKVCPDCGAVREDLQVGLEETPEAYIDKLVEIFREIRRILKDDGTLWVNIGDTYNSAPAGNKNGFSEVQSHNIGSLDMTHSKKLVNSCKPKDLIGIPWMLAFALRNDGWYLRQDIIWHKPNPMPESIRDRCTKCHEYVFLLSKSPKYYFDNEAIQEESVSYNPNRTDGHRIGGDKYHQGLYYPEYSDSKYDNAEQESQVRQGMHKHRGDGTVELRKNLPDKDTFLALIKTVSIDDVVNCGLAKTTVEHWYRSDSGFSYPSVDDWNSCRHLFKDAENFKQIDSQLLDVTIESDSVEKNFNGMRNKRDVWTVNPSSYKGAHFATFPPELITPMILAGCPFDGVVLDPFMGSGTVGVVAKENRRNYIGCELNDEYADMAEKRIGCTISSLF